MEKREIHFGIWYLIIAVIGVLWLRDIWITARQVQPIPYSQFEQQLKEDRIKEIAISKDTIQGSYKQPMADGRDRFVTTRVDPELAKDLAQYDGRIPKGVLLIGPPGTGKTLLARAVAGEAGVPFFSINGSEFVEMFVGVGAARVRDLFEQASARAPAIIFIDELDALGRARGAYPTGGHDEKEQTLNQLLVETDGFDSSHGLILLAATNRPEILDPALLRAGRFDRQVLVDRSDRIGRAEILKVHAQKIRLAADVDLDKVAALTPGFTGADLANLVNEAALFATRRGADDVGLDDFTLAVERIVAGLEKKRQVLNPREREVVAHHEMGHGHRSTGAADDLAKVTDIARSMVMRYGMDERLGHLSFEEERAPLLPTPIALQERKYSEDTAREIDRAVREIVKTAFERAFGILKRHRRILEEAARDLLRQETLGELYIATLARRLAPRGTEGSPDDGREPRTTGTVSAH